MVVFYLLSLHRLIHKKQHTYTYTHKYTIPLYAYWEERDLVNSNIELEGKSNSPRCSLLEILLE